jgi:TetR/AcrR family transcriptional regulator, transcriptional repressor for nem operon
MTPDVMDPSQQTGVGRSLARRSAQCHDARHSMRYPEGHKETVRATIVKSAARALRREGLAGVSIPALMKKAGLTHGGFYSHFESRDELVAEAVLCAAEETREAVLSREAGDIDATLARYLSIEHAQHPEQGCVLAALGTEGRKQPTPVRRAFARAARGFVSLVSDKLTARCDADAPTDEALRLAAQMVGAVVLARLVDDKPLAERILSAARRR